jgi:ferredoxin--NADP+ reductase
MATPEAIPLNLYRVSRPGLARVLANERITPSSCDDVRHIVLDLDGLTYPYLEGQSLGVLTPGVDEAGRPIKLRLYSIASSRQGDDASGRTASLCVKRVEYPDPATGATRRGVASNYLCDIEAGAPVSITGPAGRHFLLPDDPGANLILAATGTGIAPYRAFLRRVFRELPAWTGQVWLFFGAKRRGEFLYGDELESYRDRPNYRLVTAFSREEQTPDGRRMYVDHRIAEQIGPLWELLQDNRTYFYICGIKGMEDGIDRALASTAPGGPEAWQAVRAALDEGGRLRIETY